MLRPRRTLCLLAALPSAALAPAQSTFTSPSGADTAEGTLTFAMFGNRRLQCVDNTLPGPIANITAIAFRRDGLVASGGTARTLDVRVLMGVGDYATHQNDFAANFTTSTVVVATRTLSFPDWSPAPTTQPAPFTFVVPFDAPWSYPGGQALVWDVTCTNASVESHATMDRFGQSHAFGRAGTALGRGCIGGMSLEYTHTLAAHNEGPPGGMRLTWGGFGAPFRAPTTLHVDTYDAALTVPGLCTTLHSLGGIASLALGIPPRDNTIFPTTVRFPYAPALVGARVVTQLLSLDSQQVGLPISLSHGCEVTFPPYFETTYMYGPPGASSGTVGSNGTLPVARFTH